LEYQLRRGRQAALQCILTAAARLVRVALSPKTEPRDPIVAIRKLLNPAGIDAQHSGVDRFFGDQVLWEEFVQI
jgi:hypothetical protein